MTDRYSGYLVILDEDVREDDSAEGLETALYMIRGVAKVTPILGDPSAEHVGVWRERRRIIDVLNKALRELSDHD